MNTVVVKCPGCGRTYRPTLELVKAGARARCARCHTTFDMIPVTDDDELGPAGNGQATVVPPPEISTGRPAAPPPDPAAWSEPPLTTWAPPASLFPVGPPWPWAELCGPDLSALATRTGPAAAALQELLDGAPESLAVAVPAGEPADDLPPSD